MQDIQPFASPKVNLEQYPTGADIASRMLFTVDFYRDTQMAQSICFYVSGTAAHSMNRGDLSSRSVVLQVDSIYNEFHGRTVVDLGCGTVKACCPMRFLVPSLMPDPAVRCMYGGNAKLRILIPNLRKHILY